MGFNFFPFQTKPNTYNHGLDSVSRKMTTIYRDFDFIYLKYTKQIANLMCKCKDIILILLMYNAIWLLIVGRNLKD